MHIYDIKKQEFVKTPTDLLYVQKYHNDFVSGNIFKKSVFYVKSAIGKDKDIYKKTIKYNKNVGKIAKNNYDSKNISFLKRIKNWFQNIASKFCGLFHSNIVYKNDEKEKSVNISKNKIDYSKFVQDKGVKEKEFISIDTANYKQISLKGADNIVLEFENDQISKHVAPEEINKENIIIFLREFADNNMTITKKNIKDALSYALNCNVSFDENENLVIALDNNLGGFVVDKHGNILSQPNENNEYTKQISAFLHKNQNLINSFISETNADNKFLNSVRYLTENHNISYKYSGYIDVFEKSSKNNPVIINAINVSFARISGINGLSKDDVFKYGFMMPKNIIPFMDNPYDYLKVIKNIDKFYSYGYSIEEAYTIASSYIINKSKSKTPLSFVDKTVENEISNHIEYLIRNDVSPQYISNIIKSYNNLSNEQSIRIYVESINEQIERGIRVSDILKVQTPVEYTADKIAFNIQKEIKKYGVDSLVMSFNSGDVTAFNIYLKTLTNKEIHEVIDLLDFDTKEKLSQIILKTRGNIYISPNIADQVLNENIEEIGDNTVFNSDEEMVNNDNGFSITNIEPEERWIFFLVFKKYQT